MMSISDANQIRLARQCCDFGNKKCDNKDCKNKWCPLNKFWDKNNE
jgi:hypothetical protein